VHPQRHETGWRSGCGCVKGQDQANTKRHMHSCQSCQSCQSSFPVAVVHSRHRRWAHCSIDQSLILTHPTACKHPSPASPPASFTCLLSTTHHPPPALFPWTRCPYCTPYVPDRPFLLKVNRPLSADGLLPFSCLYIFIDIDTTNPGRNPRSSACHPGHTMLFDFP